MRIFFFHDRKPRSDVFLPTGWIHLTDLKDQICHISVSFLVVSRSDHLPTIWAEQLCDVHIPLERSHGSSLINKCRDNDSLEGHQDTDTNKDGQHAPHFIPHEAQTSWTKVLPSCSCEVGSLKEPKEPNRYRDFLCGTKWWTDCVPF